MNSLQKIELMEVDEIQSQEHAHFEISDLDSLNWAFRKLSALKANEKEIKQLADVERERISHWEKSELSSITNSVEFFESHIQRYHSQRLADDPKAKTISTPYGKSRTRASKEAPDKANEEQLLEYIFENDLSEFIKNSVKWADLKKTLRVVEISGEKVVIDDNGQIVPGVIVKPESVSYSVEV